MVPTLAEIADSIQRAGVLFCTVVTRSHLKYAWVLRQALRRHHPEEPFCILVLDAPADDPLPESAAFDVPILPLQDLRSQKIVDMTIYYSAYELCGNIKPYFLLHLFERTSARKIVYLDSDLFITGPLWTAIATLDTHDATAAPHTLSSLPEDGREPSDLTIAANGAYNTGFMGFRRTPEVLSLLEWMAERVHRRGFNAFSQGMFCEQRFFNLGVTFLKERFQPITLETYNVGYWNLHERVITKHAGAYFANEQRVTFFHMSGFDPDVRDRLSLYDERYDLTTHPQAAILRDLADDYRSLFANVPFASHAGYGFDVYDGIRLSPEVRRRYHRTGVLRRSVTLEEALAAARQQMEAGHPDEAARLYANILQQAPRSIETIHGYGIAAERLGDCTLARRLFHHLLALAPDHAEAASRLAALEQDGGNATSA
ncbi:tetratricopeptide repeat protein [Azospirillum sp. B506]|uniref:tetratricopeptide repeat protein n=1 Tax=Azospirillum sp. B506 TaxID=137721 RepID=UPI000344D976|nr:tetratricopeptide repeat protein [Azospirillum sp. B506]